MYSDQDLINLNRSLRAYDQMVFQTRVLTILTEVTLRLTSLKTTEGLLSFLGKMFRHQINMQQLSFLTGIPRSLIR